MSGLVQRYFIDFLKSFSMGNPDVAEAWKHLIFEDENAGFVDVAFRLPQRYSGELIIEIERLIKHKTE